MKLVRLAFSIALLATVLVLGVPQQSARADSGCGQCQCYQPNTNAYGNIVASDCPTCTDCWVPIG